MAGTRHDSNQELIGQGIANIAAPLFGGFAATGAIARTATNVRNGGTGPAGGHRSTLLTLVLVLLFLAPLAEYVPWLRSPPCCSWSLEHERGAALRAAWCGARRVPTSPSC